MTYTTLPDKDTLESNLAALDHIEALTIRTLTERDSMCERLAAALLVHEIGNAMSLGDDRTRETIAEFLDGLSDLVNETLLKHRQTCEEALGEWDRNDDAKDRKWQEGRG